MRRIAEPLLAGIYAGDLKKLSLQATFPQFAASERKHGSLIRGMQHNRKVSAAAGALPAVAKGGTFLTFKGGLSSLVNALDKALSKMQRRLSTKVVEIKRCADLALSSDQAVSSASEGARYEVVLDSGRRCGRIKS